MIKGIGTTYAKRIVSKFKENTLKILDNEPDRLLKIKGLGKKRVEIIKISWTEQKEIRSIMLFLQEHKVSTKHAYSIFQTYGNKSIEVLKKNPYRLIDEIWVIGSKIPYYDIQKKSIQVTVNSKFTVITGGAGTGKTTTTIGIIEVFKNNNFNILLAAPTGRAAKRMSEATGLEAKTIHRLLEFKPPCGYYKNEKNKLSGDVLIIDEASMIDIVLMYNLLKAVPPYMIVVLIGDKYQLPSIGCGNVFRDIIESETVPVIKLEKIYRQASNSDIIGNAHKVNKGLLLDLKNKRD